ncbi:MAG TPA: hypothetical protein VJ983_00940, partial [candidate division Zixibacteria bacterium]|nr:hypothetical protein [candidate division Zixibacteria bacterium]
MATELCEFKLWDGSECGQPVCGNKPSLCGFHSKREITSGLVGVLFNYIRSQMDRDRIDLSGMDFTDFVFDNQFSDIVQEGPRRKILFGNNRFVGCHFVGDHNYDELLFVESIFQETSFHSFRLWDSTFAMEQCQLEFGYHPMFSQFSISGQKPVDFSCCLFLGRTQPFRYALIEAPLVSFKDSEFETPRFYCKIMEDFDERQLPKEPRYLVIRAAEFRKENHRLVTVPGVVSFDGIKVNGHFEVALGPEPIMSQEASLKSDESAAILAFRSVNFGQMKSATFKRADLRRAQFKEAVIVGISDVNSIWPEKDNRRILYEDEDRSLGVAEGELRRLYSSFKKIAEQDRDDSRSDQWFYREMECRKAMTLEKHNSTGWGRLDEYFTR